MEQAIVERAAMLKWIVLATVLGWVGRLMVDRVRVAVNRPPPPRRFDVFTVLAIVVVLLWLLPFVLPFFRDAAE